LERREEQDEEVGGQHTKVESEGNNVRRGNKSENGEEGFRKTS
jgi:hypothetical protein